MDPNINNDQEQNDNLAPSPDTQIKQPSEATTIQTETTTEDMTIQVEQPTEEISPQVEQEIEAVESETEPTAQITEEPTSTAETPSTEAVVQPVETPAVEPAPAVQTTITTQPDKKSNKKLVMILVIAVAALILSVAGYFAYGYFSNQSTKTNDSVKNQEADSTNTTEEADIQTENSDINEAVKALTDGLVEESVDIDDSNIADDASSAAGAVGESINEDNL
jgi:uncharacterized protein HemX